MRAGVFGRAADLLAEIEYEHACMILTRGPDGQLTVHHMPGVDLAAIDGPEGLPFCEECAAAGAAHYVPLVGAPNTSRWPEAVAPVIEKREPEAASGEPMAAPEPMPAPASRPRPRRGAGAATEGNISRADEVRLERVLDVVIRIDEMSYLESVRSRISSGSASWLMT